MSKIMRNFCFNVLLLLIMTSFNSCHDNTTKKEKFEEQLSKANAFYKGKDYKSAFGIFDSLIKKDSLNGEIYYKRGYCKLQLFDPRTSKEDFENAVRLGYRVKDSYLNLGAIECFYNDSLAVKYFDAVLDIDSTDVKAKMYRREAIQRLNKHTNTIEL